MINQDKKSLRSLYKSIRASVEDKESKNILIADSVLKSEVFKNADTVFAYWSAGSEVDTSKIIEKALSCGKNIALPKCTDSQGNMQFYYIDSLSDLTEGMYGIMEPEGNKAADDFTASSLCLVPALSFDSDGYRLGYGKGYYDRFLSDFKGISIGLAYEECLCDSLPRDEYDKKVNYIITNIKQYDKR
jgi:5-formyltetrahydrofolate cyclo-ligase